LLQRINCYAVPPERLDCGLVLGWHLTITHKKWGGEAGRSFLYGAAEVLRSEAGNCGRVT
jgi:hypothetical protein